MNNLLLQVQQKVVSLKAGAGEHSFRGFQQVVGKD